MGSYSVNDILGPDGSIARRLPRYELRQQQLDMADAVAAAIENKRHLIVEAGTGVGKSFAYLVPAILAVGQEPRDEEEDRPRRIIVSTHTIALQEQLIQKDLPLLNSVIPLEFTAVLAKGRGNYLSKRRMGAALSRTKTLFAKDEEEHQLDHIRTWSKETSDGSLSDLEFRPLGSVWDEVHSDSGNCLGRNCPSYNDCFYYKARRRVQNAQIIIVNHALFFSDLALRRSGVNLLPKYDAVIFDEAHTIESVAGDHLGLSITSAQIDYTLNKLFNDRTNKGLLMHHGLTEAMQQVVHCQFRAQQFFTEIDAWLAENPQSSGRVRDAELVPNVLTPALAKLAAQVKNAGEDMNDDSQRQDLTSMSDRLYLLADGIESWRTQKIEDAVYWVESSQQRGPYRRVKLSAAPVDVGPALRSELFQAVDSVIMTSATLAVGGGNSFDFFKSRVGLTKSETFSLGSPFDYSEQAKLILVNEMPDPSDRKNYDKAVVEMIRRYVARTQGRAFVLFTSYEMLRWAASSLTRWLSQEGIELFSQSDGMPRSVMVEKFKQSEKAVLFGTDSFWQGVDVPGDALQNVIITKLPFSVPDQPLLQARLERIKEQGGQPFGQYQLPEAVIKLRQGFGRLIRTQEDSGIVVILDPRVKTKSYGKVFLKSLPDCPIVNESYKGGAFA
ncbi:ATP-dependent DNA helicase [Blastopirellula retiformator]|uniref:DNA 5'-3' helicase n=1 Tax=Blastopirellula retiformator TaxID=2527970 RepID=A0A5C5VKU7_9BACT|nr:helicase C-terminal domain-containing protein [Blastopirellula retiformator]TWT38550.1 putative ATP-dependent helicase DinG [Blastopirellula retiformator]